MKKWLVAIIAIVAVCSTSWIVYDRIRPTNTETITGPKTSSTLNLNDKGLTAVGPEVYNKTKTTTLILSNNSIQTLPTEMGKLTKLEILKVDHNRLDGSLIGEIRMMPLKSLDASYNNMTGMPAEIGQLNKLTYLDYSYNKLTAIPNEISNLRNNLKEFNLSGNPLSKGTLDKLQADLPNTTIVY